MPSHYDRLPPRTAPRGLTVFQAAAFAGVELNDYKLACERGEYPHPTLAGGRVDRKLLERHMDQLSGIVAGADALDPLAAWERKRAARQA